MRSEVLKTTGAAALLIPLALATLLGVASCGQNRSFIVVTLQAADAPISDVKTVSVAVTDAKDTNHITLTYQGKGTTIRPATPAAIGVDGGAADGGAAGAAGVEPPVTLSVSFDGDRRGAVSMVVEVSDASGCRIASGTGGATILRNDIGALTIIVRPHAPNCTSPDAATDQATDGGDGGTDGGPPEVTPFPGCDPALASTCGAGKTCYVDCTAGQGVCAPAGPAGPGEACPMDTGSCQQGTQCFNYKATTDMCPARVCLKFCKTDTDCTSATGIGLGPGSLCKGPVVCDGVATGHKTCTFGCDPRTNQTGCPSSLSCFLVDTHDQVDCRCKPTSATKNEGDDCAVFADCRPGMICAGSASAQQKCRKICKVGASDCSVGQTCTMLKDDTAYGVCL